MVLLWAVAPCKHPASPSGGSRDSGVCRGQLWSYVKARDLCAQELEVVIGKEKRENQEGGFWDQGLGKRSPLEKLESSICVRVHKACKDTTTQVVHSDSHMQGAHEVHTKWWGLQVQMKRFRGVSWMKVRATVVTKEKKLFSHEIVKNSCFTHSGLQCLRRLGSKSQQWNLRMYSSKAQANTFSRCLKVICVLINITAFSPWTEPVWNVSFTVVLFLASYVKLNLCFSPFHGN